MRFYRASSLALLALPAVSVAATSLTLTPSGATTQWKRSEFRIGNVPAATNPFNPDAIAVDATITTPTNRILTVPAFWYQNYTRKLSKAGIESLAVSGAPEWRLRFLPTEPGKHTVVLTVKRPNQTTLTLSTSFAVSGAKPSGPVGVARVAASRQGFETTHGEALPLSGVDLLGPGDGKTYDYDRWLGQMGTNGQNYTRVHMTPWFGGIENDPAALTNYSLDQAWRMDYLFTLAEQKGVQIQLALDHVAMFNSVAGHYNTAEWWSKNPYNAVNNGPCLVEDDFFTSGAAKKAYKKRLRYLIARYGASPKLFSWEFVDALDIVYPPVDAGHAATWIGEIGSWLKANDPYGHLVTSGFANASHPEAWSLAALDYVGTQYYSLANPATTIANQLVSMQAQYAKPAIVTSFAFDPVADPYLRGFRQAQWGAAVGGGTGTAMTWNYGAIDTATVDAVFAKLKKALGATAWGTGATTPLTFGTVAEADALGDAIPGGAPFAVQIPTAPQWGATVEGTLAVPSADLAGRGAGQLPGYVDGEWHADIRKPFRVVARYGANAKFTVNVKGFNNAASVQVLVDGQLASETTLPGVDGEMHPDYTQKIDVPIAAGKHTVELRDGGRDWFYVDSIGLTNALPSRYAGSLVAVGKRGAKEVLAYVVSPTAAFPVNAKVKTIPNTVGAKLALLNMAAGTYIATWTRVVDGASLGSTTTVASGGTLSLAVPSFSEELFVRIVKK